MDRPQFEQRVLASAGPYLRRSDALKVALFDAAQKNKVFREQDVREALARARVISEGSLTSRDGDGAEKVVRKERGAEAHFISRELMKALSPEIAAPQVRRTPRQGTALPPVTLPSRKRQHGLRK